LLHILCSSLKHCCRWPTIRPRITGWLYSLLHECWVWFAFTELCITLDKDTLREDFLIFSNLKKQTSHLFSGEQLGNSYSVL